MKIYSAIQIGEHHTNHCEDYLFVGDIGENKILCAVMDGCTMGTDSYFASTLVGKLLKKIATERSYRELYNLEQPEQDIDAYLKLVVGDLFRELKIVKNQIMLDKNEFLTTLILLLTDRKTRTGAVLVIGDGLVCIDGQKTEYDQNNKPDYLGYHLNEDFDKWYNSQTQKVSFASFQDISIATDGIFTFSPIGKTQATKHIDPVDYFVLETSLTESKEMISQKLRRLERDFGLKPTDDFAMIRLRA